MSRVKRIEISPEMLVMFFKEGRRTLFEVLQGFPADFNLVHTQVKIDTNRNIQKIVLYGTSHSFDDIGEKNEPPLLDIVVREENLLQSENIKRY